MSLVLPKKLSIVVPLYYEEGNVLPLHGEILEALHRDFPGVAYEIIFIDDGSQDNTWIEVGQCVEKDAGTVGLRQNRNYGQAIAMDAGFQYASGDIVVSLDGDRQNDPADIIKLYTQMIEEDLDLVAGWRAKRKDPTWMLFITKTARFLRKSLINDGVHDSGCTLRVYKHEVVKDLYLWGEMHRYIIALSKINGYKIGEQRVNHRAREIGTSKYNWMKSFKGLMDLIYIWFIGKYKARPLHLMGFLGGINFCIGGVFILYSLFQRLFYTVDLTDNGAFIIGALLFQFGFIVFLFGLVLDLLIRTYDNTARERRYITREVITGK